MQVNNSKRRFGEGTEYIFVQIHGRPALLTPAAAADAINRARVQPEDVPTLWMRFCSWLMSV